MSSGSMKNSQMALVAKQWSTFLFDLSVKLSLYEIQKNRENYNVLDIKYWGTSGKQQGIKITKDIFGLFLNKTAQYNITSYDTIRTITITESQLQELNHILSLTLKPEVTKSCSIPNELVIKGDYIKFSDFIKTDGNLNLNEGCKNITDVNIFALNTVFVDRDVILNGTKINFGIISPKWEIIGTRRIELSGAEGQSKKVAAQDIRKKNAVAGEPGSPGKVGGNFFGIGAEFVNGKDFAIISNGGKGGAADDGEDGEDGDNGYLTFIFDRETRCTYSTCLLQQEFIDFDGNVWPCTQEHFDMEQTLDNLNIHCKLKIYGLKATEGRNATDGGKGGKGGNPGNIVLLELNEPSRISRYNKIGDRGKNGRGGAGGDGGIDGDDVLLDYEGTGNNHTWHIESIIQNKERRERGRNGIDGANEEGLQCPENADSPESAKILRKYKSYLRDNMNDPFKNYSLMKFLRQLDNNDNVKSVYDTLELFNELKELEHQFPNFNNNVDVIALYKSLLNRISEYAQNPKDIERSSQYKKTLIYLFTATLGKISFLENQSQSNLIIDIDSHLDLIVKDIESMRNLQIAIDKTDLINEYKGNYERDVDSEIDEVKSMIERQIIPKMNDVTVRIDDEIALMVAETRKMEKAVGNERSELIDERERLKKTIMWRGLFGTLKIIGKAVSILGPIGFAAGSLIGRISRGIESLITAEEEQKRLKSEIQSSADKIETAKNEQVNNFNDLLKVISEKIAVDPKKFNDLAAKISEMGKRLRKDQGFKFSQVERMEMELKDLLKRKEKQLTDSTKSAKNNEKTASAIEIMRKIYQAVQIYTVGFDMYDKFKTDEANLNEISAAIAQKTENIEELQQYERYIYNITIPMLQVMEDTLRGIVSKIDEKSGISLDVTKWQVQSNLKDLKVTMKKLIRIFPDVKDDLLNCTEMLEDTMTTLINIFDRMQDYQRKQKFVNFFADMSRITGSDVRITDSRLSEAINLDTLEELIRSNYVIMKHKVAIEAFKNFVFPLAHVYLRNSKLPLHLQLENNFENLLSKATSQIEYVKPKTAIYKTNLNGAGYNQYIKLGPFTSFYTSTDPFFVWKNSENKDLIEKLLTGQKVTVRADVMDSPTFKDAIKFSVAVFYFRAQNETIQNKVNNVLKGFEIEATHLGDSHYRCNDKYYRITGNATIISYYLEKKPDGQPVSTSLTYIGLKEEDSILSPYATWEVILMRSTNRVTYSDLQKYKDVVDLELMGDGSYIDNRRVDYSKLTVEKYYQGIMMSNQRDGHPKSETIEGCDPRSNRRNARSIYRPKDNPISSSVESSSPISKLGSYWNPKMMMPEYLGTVEKMKGWLGREVSQRDEESSGDFPHDVNDLSYFNLNTAFSNLLGSSKVEHSSNGFMDRENNSPGFVNYGSLDTHGNLLLLDMVFRKKNFTNYKNEDNAIKNNMDTEYAQSRAYSAHAP